MSTLEVYLLAVPVVITGLGWLFAQWIMRQ